MAVCEKPKVATFGTVQRAAFEHTDGPQSRPYGSICEPACCRRERLAILLNNTFSFRIPHWDSTVDLTVNLTVDSTNTHTVEFWVNGSSNFFFGTLRTFATQSVGTRRAAHTVGRRRVDSRNGRTEHWSRFHWRGPQAQRLT